MFKPGTKVKIVRIDDDPLDGPPANMDCPEDHAWQELIGLTGVVLHDEYKTEAARISGTIDGELNRWFVKLDNPLDWIPADKPLSFFIEELEAV